MQNISLLDIFLPCLQLSFFEEFYHLATGFNYEIDTGIPKDETEAEIYLSRLQEEFDEKMKIKLGEKYLPGNNDPDSIQNDR